MSELGINCAPREGDVLQMSHTVLKNVKTEKTKKESKVTAIHSRSCYDRATCQWLCEDTIMFVDNC